MKVFGVLVLLAGLSLTCSSAEPSKRLTEYGLIEESLSSCNLERTDPSCGPASTEQVIESPVAGYKQFLHERGSPWFVAPCQIVGRPLAIEDNPSDQALEDLYLHIANVADRALNHMYGFVGEFFLKTYGADNVSFHEFWKANCYDWLPNHILIPKNLGETLPQEYLDTVIKDLNGLTLNASMFMRLAGYGLSKIEEDQKKRLTPYGFLFSNTRELLQKLQCDMEAAVLIYEPLRPDLPLLYINFLEEKLVTDYEFEAVRDWIIIREYMNTLEWFIQCITHYTDFLSLSEKSCNSEVTDPSCRTTNQVIGSSLAGYKQFVRDEGSPWYIDPCQNDEKPIVIDDDPSDQAIEDLLLHVTKLADLALSQMKSFISNYIEVTQSVEYEKFKSFWQSNCYDWLPGYNFIPKKLGDSLPQEYLNTVDRDLKGLTLNASRFMRIYGYGLAHVEQQNKEGSFGIYFANAMKLLQKFQCDLEAAVLVYDPERTELPPLNLDFLNDPEVNTELEGVRNWIILREYMNALEWFIQAVTHYTDSLRSLKVIPLGS